MDKKKYIFLIVSLAIFVFAILYSKFVIFAPDGGNKDLDMRIKWIPAFLLMAQTLLFLRWGMERFQDFQNCILLFLAYILCIIGDVLLACNTNTMYLIGMAMFMVAYILFGSAKLFKINGPINMEYRFKIYMGALVLIIIEGITIPFVVEVVSSSDSHGLIFGIAVCVYSLFVLFSIFCNYLNMVVNGGNRESWYSLVGIVMFAFSDCIVILNDMRYDYAILRAFAMFFYWMALTLISWSVYCKPTRVTICTIGSIDDINDYDDNDNDEYV